MRDGDPRRIGHELIITGRTPRGRVQGGGGQFYGTTGHCACAPSTARFTSERPPSSGGLTDVRAEHERHVEAVEGPPLPFLSRPQREALLSYSTMIHRLTAGRGITLDALARAGLLVVVAPLPGEVGGQWVPTEAGLRVIRLLRRPRAA